MLLAMGRYAEKQVGYVACAIFLNEKDELLRLVINSVRNDLISRNETFQCLALEFTANGGCRMPLALPSAHTHSRAIIPGPRHLYSSLCSPRCCWHGSISLFISLSCLLPGDGGL